MSNFMFLRHVLTGAVKLPFALSYFSSMCNTRTPCLFSSLLLYACILCPLFLSYCVREGSPFSDPVRLSLILLGEPDDGVRLTLLTS
jgi:hypothetical protein